MTHLGRRSFLKMAGSAFALPAGSQVVRAADEYPSHSLRWIVTSAPGGTADILTRLISQKLSERLGQPVIVENKPGGGVDIATETAAKAPADGYTLLDVNRGQIVSEAIGTNPNFKFSRDFEALAAIASGPLVMLLHPSVQAENVPEFLAYAKKNPGKINYGSAGLGTDPHLAGVLLTALTGLELTHVPYRGGGLALNDLLGGQIQLMFSNLPSAAFVKSGQLRALATTAKTHSDVFPDLPPLAQFVPDYEIEGWHGVSVRTGTEPGIADRLNNLINAALTDPQVVTGIANLQSRPTPLTRSDFGNFIDAERAKWTPIIKSAGIKME
jgi:tripartite-type tricarboxylate transporter receptor subunit TctC